MPRRTLILNSECPYHVTNRSNNKEWFYIPLNEVWMIFTRSAESFQYYVCSDQIHSFVLMSNSFHLLISTPHSNLDLFMRHCQTEISRKIQKRASRINHVFGSRYKWSLLWNPAAFAYAYKYVTQNAVKAGLIKKVEYYPLVQRLSRGT